MTNEELIKYAIKAQKYSYSPYSKFRVGTALLSTKGKVYLGANIENSSYPAGICGERCVFCHAIARGVKGFEKIAIVGSGDEYCFPCGICRQFMVEMAPHLEVVCANNKGEYKQYTIRQLLTNAFTEENLEQEKTEE